jgi:tetratricopeptide (TPR) repeat protein
LHTFNGRSNAKTAIAGFLTDGGAAPGMLLTGNASLSVSADNPSVAEVLAAQKVSYAKKIAVARRLGEYKEAASYAEDALSLFPQDFGFHATAAELYYKQGEVTQGAAHFKAAAPDATLTSRKTHARLLLRSGDVEAFRKFLEANADLKSDLARDATEFEALMQLAAFARGDIALLAGPMPWEDIQKLKKAGKRIDLSQALSKDLKNEELRNEVCNAAIAALEFRLVNNSCLVGGGVREAEKAERERVRDLFFTEKPAALKAIDPEDLEFVRSVALIKSGYAADAVVSARRFLLALKLSTSENLLTLALLHVLAERKANTADSKAVARLLSDYGREARKKARNKQTESYYHLLELTADTFEKGESALGGFTAIAPASGTISAENNIRMLGISVLPAPTSQAAIHSSGFPRDKSLEADLQFFGATANGYGDDVDCALHNCAPLMKRHLARGENDAVLFLMLRTQKSIASRTSVAACVLAAASANAAP